MEQLKKSSVVMVSRATFDRQGGLEHYLPYNVNTFAAVEIAAPNNVLNLQCRLYEQGKVVKKLNLHYIKIPCFKLFFLPLVYISRTISIIYLLLRMKRKFDIYIGNGYFLTLLGLMLRRMKLVHKVIFYCGDYFQLPTKERKESTLYFQIARLIDRFCTNHCDIGWNASQGIIEIKRQEKIITPKSPPQIVVPTGINTKEIYQKPLSQIDTSSVGFMGQLNYLSGLDLLLEAFQEIKEEIPNIKLNIIGSGPYEKTLRTIVQKKGLMNHVIFWGFVADKIKVREILSNCAIGVAPYTPDISGFTQYTEPGKVMEYLTLGLPVVVTKVPRIASVIESRRAGFAIEYNKKELVDAILKLLSDRELLKEYRENALQLAFDYDWEIIINKALSESTVLFR